MSRSSHGSAVTCGQLFRTGGIKQSSGRFAEGNSAIYAGRMYGTLMGIRVSPTVILREFWKNTSLVIVTSLNELSEASYWAWPVTSLGGGQTPGAFIFRTFIIYKDMICSIAYCMREHYTGNRIRRGGGGARWACRFLSLWACPYWGIMCSNQLLGTGKVERCPCLPTCFLVMQLRPTLWDAA